MITEKHLSGCMNYEQYKRLLSELLKEGKTTGFDQSAAKLEGAQLNFQRMLRVGRHVSLHDKLKAALDGLKGEFLWIVITEGWCADTAQQVPLFHAIGQYTSKISLCLILRDENPEVMDQYLTNGSRSIPKIICVEKKTLEERFTWGPRPAELQQKVKALIAGGGSNEQKALLLQRWYNADKTQRLQDELVELIRANLQ